MQLYKVVVINPLRDVPVSLPHLLTAPEAFQIGMDPQQILSDISAIASPTFLSRRNPALLSSGLRL